MIDNACGFHKAIRRARFHTQPRAQRAGTLAMQRIYPKRVAARYQFAKKPSRHYLHLVRGRVLLVQRQFRIFAVFQQFRLVKQPTIQRPPGGDNQFLKPATDGEKGNAPFQRALNQRDAQSVPPGIGGRLIAVFTIQDTGAAERCWGCPAA